VGICKFLGFKGGNPTRMRAALVVSPVASMGTLPLCDRPKTLAKHWRIVRSKRKSKPRFVKCIVKRFSSFVAIQNNSGEMGLKERKWEPAKIQRRDTFDSLNRGVAFDIAFWTQLSSRAGPHLCAVG